MNEKRRQLYAARDALTRYLQSKLSEYTSMEELHIIEDYACHLTNVLEGTPCHPTCTVCHKDES